MTYAKKPKITINERAFTMAQAKEVMKAKLRKERLYDKISRLLTDYENPHECQESVTEKDLYDVLVEVQNCWAETVAAFDY